MSPDCGLKTQIVLHSSGTKPRLKLQQRVNWVVGWVERSETQHKLARVKLARGKF